MTGEEDLVRSLSAGKITITQAEDAVIYARGCSRIVARTHLRSAARAIFGRVQELGCACCGGIAPGRQWWNQDRGYGVCQTCVDWMLKRGSETPAQIYDYYGAEGIHWGAALEAQHEQDASST